MNNFHTEFEDKKPPHNPNHPGKPEHPVHPEPPEHPEKPEHPNRITVLVNGEEKMLLPHIKQLSYDEIVKLAYGTLPTNPNTIYTVAYSNGPIENPKGTLTRGRAVLVKEGMVFNVSKSDKS